MASTTPIPFSVRVIDGGIVQVGSNDRDTVVVQEDTIRVVAVGAAAIAPTPSSVVVEDEGTPLAVGATTLNFVGAGVTAAGAGTTKTITIPGGGGATQVNTLGIAAGTTTIASVALASFCAVKWQVLVVDGTNTLKRWSEIGAVKASALEHNQFGNLGDTIPFTLDVVEVAGSMELQLTNTGAFSLDAHVQQLPMAV